MAIFNQAITSLRALSKLRRCQKMRQVTREPFAASSFSAGQHLFAPQILHQVVRELTLELRAKGLGQQQQGGDARVRQALKTLSAVDGPPRPLSAEDRKAGVVWDRRMRLGVHETGPLLRVVGWKPRTKSFTWPLRAGTWRPN